jgi:hypothetical protein
MKNKIKNTCFVFFIPIFFIETKKPGVFWKCIRKNFRILMWYEGIFGKKIATTRTLCFLNYKFLAKKFKLHNSIIEIFNK